MGIDAFVIYDVEPLAFAERFLASPEFTIDLLRQIKRTLHLRGASGSKAEIAHTIMSAVGSISQEAIAQLAITTLPQRRREWMTIKVGQTSPPPMLRDAAELVFSPGENEWYGPLIRADDDPNVQWYVYPTIVPHWELDSQGTPRQYHVRWFCWARLACDHLSMHWSNFTYGDTVAHAGGSSSRQHTVQFAYWLHVPRLFDTLTSLLGAQMTYINLQQIALHRLWDRYIGQDGYHWRHRRIRAEAGGVSLSAYAGRAVVEMGTSGIEHLASTIRRAVEDDLASSYNIHLPEPEHVDDVILRTIIREYGTVSYEFNLAGTDPIIDAHVYFGTKQNAVLQDSFPHVRLTNARISDLAQLSFLLHHQL